MSRTGLFLLITMITGFAFIQKTQANISIIYKCQPAKDTGVVSIDTLCLLKDARIETTVLSTSHTPADPSVKKKIICALFALPFPCGFVGAHRVMLGTSPWVPVVYVATFGGCFGLLPLIDFCFITFSKDITPYENNPHVFMWMK